MVHHLKINQCNHINGMKKKDHILIATEKNWPGIKIYYKAIVIKVVIPAQWEIRGVGKTVHTLAQIKVVAANYTSSFSFSLPHTVKTNKINRKPVSHKNVFDETYLISLNLDFWVCIILLKANLKMKWEMHK